MLVFQEGGKLENPEKTLGARREPTTNSTHIWHRAGIERGSHWWEASTLTTEPSLLFCRSRIQGYSQNEKSRNSSNQLTNDIQFKIFNYHSLSQNKEPSLTRALRIRWFKAYARLFVHKTAVYLLSCGQRKNSRGNLHYFPYFIGYCYQNYFGRSSFPCTTWPSPWFSSEVLLLSNTTYLHEVMLSLSYIRSISSVLLDWEMRLETVRRVPFDVLVPQNCFGERRFSIYMYITEMVSPFKRQNLLII